MVAEESKAVVVALAAAALMPAGLRQQLVGNGAERRRVFFRIFSTILGLQAARRFLTELRHLGIKGTSSRVVRALTGVAIELPGVKGIVMKEVNKELADVETKMHGDGDPTGRLRMPQKGMASAEIVAAAKALQDKEMEGFYKEDAKQWGGIYHSPHGALTELQNQLLCMYNSTNTLYENVFPSVRKFEAELISFVMNIVHCDPVIGGGLLTSGGTESVLIAALAYREQGRLRGIRTPRVLAANTCHPAIAKACHYFGMNLTKIKVDASTGFALSARALRGHLTSDVVCIYASAPTFPHGVVDNVEDLGRLAKSKGIGLHVDNCMGGIILSCVDRQGLTDAHQMWDFRAEGVTSISTDLHKYGCASKGVSVVTFRDQALRRLTYVPCTDGAEGLYITSTLQGARGGAVMAQAWATMLHFGDEGYDAYAKGIHTVYKQYQEAVARVPHMRVLCTCHACIMPIASDKYNIYSVATLMEDRGWNLFTGQDPPVMSVCIGDRHGKILRAFEDDLTAVAKHLDKEPNFKPKGTAAVYGAMATTPPAILEQVVRRYVDMKLTVKPSAPVAA